MNKWILTLLVVCAGAFGFWKFDPLQMFGEKGGTNNLLNYIPADTVFYFGGKSDQALLDFMADYPLGTSPSQSVVFEGLRDELVSGESPFGKLANYLLEDYSKTADNTYGGLLHYLGMGAGGEFAVYMHGVVPVVNIPLADVEKFRLLVEKASTEAGLEYQEKSVGNAALRTWVIGEGSEQHGDFVIATSVNSAIITFIGKEDSEQVIQERLAQLKIENSLASSSEVSQLKEKYGYTDDALMFINFENFLMGIFNSEESSFGKDLFRYLPKEAKDGLANNLSDACKKDYLSLVSNMPRMVGGYTSIELKNDSMMSEFQFLFEIKNTVVTSELQKMQGHIPAHVLKSNDKLFGFGIAVDVDQLTPAVTAMWTTFINADFTCDQLVEAQNKARQTSPAMMGMATGMAQGVKGAGFSLYDFSWDAAINLPKDVNAVLSVAASNPQSVLSLLQMAPMLGGISVPQDGTPTKLNLPMLPPGLEIFAAVKGQHIVVYSGSKGEETAQALASEDVAANGVYAASLNYRKLLEIGKTFDIASSPVGKDGACIQYYEFMHMMDAMRMDFSFLLNAIDDGIELQANGTMDKPTRKSALDVAGTWKVELLDEGCQWVDSGKDQLMNDGAGTYIELDESGQCETHSLAYNWEKHGGKIIFTGFGKEKFRDSCDEEWQEDDAVNYECYIMNSEGSSFQCLFDPGTEDASLFRYSKM